MSRHNCGLTGVCMAAALLVSAITAVAAEPPDALSQSAKWQVSDPSRVRTETLAWLAEKQADEATLAKAAELFSALPEQPTGDELLECLTATVALADPDAAELVRLCSEVNRPPSLPAVPWLSDEKTLPLVTANMRLLYGRWLIHQRMYDEAIQRLAGLQPDDVVAPASLLFYQSVAYHTMLDREAGLDAIDRLLSGSEQSPRRYVALAQLMQQDLQLLEDDSLDHIARRMGDIRRRLDLGRAGEKVREVEDGVIESLDKLIKKLEEQKKKSSGGGSNNIRSNKPAPDSTPMGGKGKGDVAKRPIGSKSGWGNLPPKQREEVLQQIGRDFPAHYRDVIEQYFRQLAAEEDK